jgi:hypothetical protein
VLVMVKLLSSYLLKRASTYSLGPSAALHRV